MKFSVGDAVVSRAGHDEGKLFLVVAAEEPFAWICDGRTRKTEKPKKKKFRHLAKAGVCADVAAGQVQAGALHDKDVRRMLAEISNKDGE